MLLGSATRDYSGRNTSFSNNSNKCHSGSIKAESNKSQHGLIGWPCSHPGDGHSSVLLNEPNVVHCLLGEVLWLGDLTYVFLPSGQGLVLHFNLLKLFQVSRQTVNFAAVEFIANTHLNGLEGVEDIELGQVPRGVAVDHVGVPK